MTYDEYEFEDGIRRLNFGPSSGGKKMTDENYWYGAPKAGEFGFEIQVFGERFKEAFKNIADGVEIAMHEIMLNSAITILERKQDEYRNLLESVGYGGNTWYDIRIMKYFEIRDRMSHYDFVIEDLKGEK